ncbi:aLK and LTK ligand 2a [Menidia menidia]
MSGLRRHVMMGLVLLMCTLTEHCSESAPCTSPTSTTSTSTSSTTSTTSAASAAGGDALRDLKRIVEIVKHVEDHRGRHGGKTEAPQTSRTESSTLVQRDFRNRTERGNHAVFPWDLKKKEKFIKYITGPLYFSPKCRKTVYKVYHNTRDCTVPTFFKRCARLLSRLAGSPQCTEG